MSKAINVTIIGGGMITNDLLLPTIYHLQRRGIVGNIKICALNNQPLKALKENKEIEEAFPGQDFEPYPSFNEPSDKNFPELYKAVLKEMNSRQAVVVATPDQFHYQMVMETLSSNQHILCVKPLVLKYKQAVEIEKAAYEKGLFVGVEYHKRFDRRNLLAKSAYKFGSFGEFTIGEAKLIEPYFYRESNFQNWFTTENTDPFVYVGCHYVDLVYFITGLKPVEVSVAGVKGKFPNGNEGYLWANGRVHFENGAILSITNGLGYPSEGAGSNEQCLTMYCEGDKKIGLIEHNDQFRGVTHTYVDSQGTAKKQFHFVNPDFIRFVIWGDAGLKPIGYGFESVAASIRTMHRIENAVESLDKNESLKKRQEIIKEIDEKGIIATPSNSSINELVDEAGRLSILNDGMPASIIYGDDPHVKLK
jgi:predicted dehydrogenase